MRHAKSDWAEPELTDFDRPLNARGREAAPKMARCLVTAGLLPDVILASSARRVRETVSGLMTVWDSQPPVHETRELYLATPETILRTIRSDVSEQSTVMVIAHNPGMQHLASQLAGRELHFPTAALACFDFEIDDWQQLQLSCQASLVEHVFPKGLDD